MEDYSVLIEKEKYDSKIKLIYKGLYLLMFAYVLFYPHMINTLNYYIGRGLVLLNTITVIYISIASLLRNKLLVSWAFLFCIGASLIFSNENIERNQFIQNFFSFLCLTTLIEGQVFIKTDKSLVKFIGYINIMMCAVFLIYSFMPFAYRVESSEYTYETNAISLGYSNPNATSMMLLYAAAINFIMMRCKLLNKPLAFIIHAVLIYLTFRTSSRTAFVCIMVLTLFAFISFKKIQQIFLYIFMAIPIIYIFLLPYLSSIGFLADLKIFGKSIYTMREDMFVERIGYLEGAFEWIFGDMAQGMFINHHNGMLSLLITIGIVGLGLYLFIWAKNIIPYMNNTNPVSYMAISALLVILLQSSAEASFVTGGIPYNIMLVTLFIFARFDFKSIEEGQAGKNEATAY